MFLRATMDSGKCCHCRSNFSEKSLCRVDEKLTRNKKIFNETFLKLNIMFPMFCKPCQKIWLKLETIRGKSNITKFISDREKERNNKDEVTEKFVSDEDPLAVPSSSALVRTNTNYEQVLPGKVISAHLSSCDPIEDLKQPGPSTVVSDATKETSKMKEESVGENTQKNYEYWEKLFFKTFVSDGIGAKTREEFRYYSKKMKEAKEKGVAEDEVKDYNYWCALFIEKFKSPECDKECGEDLDYYFKMMSEAKQNK